MIIEIEIIMRMKDFIYFLLLLAKPIWEKDKQL